MISHKNTNSKITLTICIPFYKPYFKFNSDLFISLSRQSFSNVFFLFVVNKGDYNDFIATYKNHIKNVSILLCDEDDVCSKRNQGILECKTDYITFLDNDDYISDNFCKIILEKLEQFKPDLLICDRTNKVEILGTYDGCELLLSNSNFKDFYFYEYKYGCRNTKLHTGMSAGKVFLVNIIKNNNIFYKIPPFTSEDLIFNLSFVEQANTCIVLENFYGNYVRLHRESVTVNVNSFYYNLIPFCKYFYDVCFDILTPEEIKNHLLFRCAGQLFDVSHAYLHGRLSICSFKRYLKKNFYKNSPPYLIIIHESKGETKYKKVASLLKSGLFCFCCFELFSKIKIYFRKILLKIWNKVYRY